MGKSAGTLVRLLSLKSSRRNFGELTNAPLSTDSIFFCKRRTGNLAYQFTQQTIYTSRIYRPTGDFLQPRITTSCRFSNPEKALFFRIRASRQDKSKYVTVGGISSGSTEGKWLWPKNRCVSLVMYTPAIKKKRHPMLNHEMNFPALFLNIVTPSDIDDIQQWICDYIFRMI